MGHFPFKKKEPGWLKRAGKKALALVTAAATLATGMIGASTAAAATDVGPGYYLGAYNVDSSWAEAGITELGVMGYKDGRPVYCIELGTSPADVDNGMWATATDSTSRIAAWMVEQNMDDMSDMTQAAVAYAIHKHLDRNTTKAMAIIDQAGLVGADVNTMKALGDKLWSNAEATMPVSAQVKYAYTSGKRTGTATPILMNLNGDPVSGVKFTLTLNGPAVFDSTGTKSITGTLDGTTSQHFSWTATGTGEVTGRVTYKNVNPILQSAPNQDLFGTKDPSTTSKGIAFDVQATFQPTLTTEASGKELDKGQTVVDKVTSGVVSGDSWPSGVSFKAEGYYFVGSSKDALAEFPQNGTVESPEAPADYLARLKAKLGNPVATATTTFTGAGQTQTVTAKNADGSDYKVSENGLFGSWYWTISMNSQADANKTYLKHSYNDVFGKVEETSSHRNQMSHQSTVLEQYSGLNKDIMDTITISGLPDDYGEFDGSAAYGFDKDATATIRVWWAGSGTGDSTQDEQYKPSTTEEPSKDANHKIVGEWEVPARNGTYRVGGGKIDLTTSDGKTTTVADNVNISAKKANETGYYVFVYDFPGSSRAEAFKSDYNDPWERSFVEQASSTVSLTSNVSATEVAQGEEFYDVATITGAVAEGSYVEFTAYDAVNSNTPDVSAKKLIDRQRVAITAEQATQSASSSIDVKSPKTKTDSTGNVYWQAALYDPNGEPLATHELGIASETVIVRGVSLTSKVSAENVYVNEQFRDTATIQGKVAEGDYVVFEAWGPVDGDYVDGTPKLLDGAKVTIDKATADKSSWTTSFTVDSPYISSPDAGYVYWKATLYRADGLMLATHEIGATGEVVRVSQPTITTQVTKTTAKPGEEFADKATITGTVPEGSYVTFDAYQPVSGQPDTSVGKLLDSVKVQISAEDAAASATRQITVTSPATKTNDSGSVYWKATLYTKDGTAIATHDLGLPEETTYIAPGGYLSSEAQVMGATGEQLYDMITVYDETDGHEGNGNSNPAGVIGSIPEGSIVTVEAYRQDGNNTASKNNRLGSADFTISRKDMADGKYTFKATDPSFTMDSAGLVYWVATLKTANGAVLDKATFGESGDQHGTGVESYERTPVQDYTTTISKKWFSVNSDEYAEKTVSVYDVLKQTSFEQQDGDVAVLIGQTAKNTTYQFEVWKQGAGDVSTDKLMWTGEQHTMPQSKLSMNDNKGDSVWQQMKSETFTIGKDWGHGTYYVRVLVTNPQVDNTVEGRKNVVKYTAARDEAETFRVIDVTSLSVEPLWVDVQAHVQDALKVKGTLPKGSSYQVELWSTDDDGNVTEKLSESERISVENDLTDTTVTLPEFDNPKTVGGYQWRFRVWSPDNLGELEDGYESGSVILSDDWQQGDGYTDANLIYDGENVPDEHFEIIHIDTNVANTVNVVTYDGENYVDVTDGADVQDYATITGKLLDGYKLGFNLYKQAEGDDESQDRFIASIDPVDLEAGATELKSATAHITEPGRYYWQFVFSKQSGEAFQPDGELQVVSAKRIPEESFNAARVTTTTAKWTSKDGVTKDTALIEGCVPEDSTILFELHDYETGDLISTTDKATLKDLGYQPCSSSEDVQQVESAEVAIPDTGDYYFVERVIFPTGDEFHRGNDRVDYESTRAIAATTETLVERHKGTAVADNTQLDNITYTNADDEEILRDDLIDSRLYASWEVWQQGDGDETTDTKLDTLADGDNAVELEDGQTEAVSPAYLFNETGTYYFRVLIKDETGAVVAYGPAREPSETIRIIDSHSNAEYDVAEADTEFHDTVTILGPVVAGTMVGWDVYVQGDGDATTDTLKESWQTPETGAYVITDEDAATAAKEGSVTITSPNAYKGEAGDTVYFVYSLYSPGRDEDGNAKKAVKGEDGVYTLDHLETTAAKSIQDEASDDADTDEAAADGEESLLAIHTDTARLLAETTYVIRITTKASTSEALVGDTIHDTAIITGFVPDGYCVEFEYWQQNTGDVDKDKLVTTTECVPVKPGATTVDSPDLTAENAGTFYFRERLTDTGKTRTVTYGAPRVKDETVTVTKPLANTGTAILGVAGAAMLAGLAGVGVLMGVKRRGNSTVGTAKHSR